MNYKFVTLAVFVFLSVSILLFIIKHEKKRFKKKTEKLKSLIKQNIDNTLDCGKVSRMKQLLLYDVKTERDYQELLFLYHGGLLRTKEEIDKHKLFTKYNQFDENRHVVNSFAYIFPFVITFVIVVLSYDCPYVNIVIALFAGMLAAMIGSLIGYAINVSNASSLEIDESSQAVVEERNKFTAGTITTGTTMLYVAKKTKDGIKEVADPDSWKEMK